MRSCNPDEVLHAAAGTPYEGGAFRMKMILGADFPRTPPKGMPQPRACYTPKNTHMSSNCGVQIFALPLPLVPAHDLGRHLGIISGLFWSMAPAMPATLKAACATWHNPCSLNHPLRVCGAAVLDTLSVPQCMPGLDAAFNS